MLGKIFQIRNTILKIIDNKVFKRIVIILGTLIFIILGLFSIWKNTHKDLQTNTNEMLKLFITIDMGLSEDDSDELLQLINDTDNLAIDNILNKYTNGFQFVEILSEVSDEATDIKDIISPADVDAIQDILKKYLAD